jgi:hypothetical protein
MAIEKEILYVLSCDSQDCHETHEWHPGFSRSYMIRVARDNGWGVHRGRGGKVLSIACPDHNDFDNGE